MEDLSRNPAQMPETRTGAHPLESGRAGEATGGVFPVPPVTAGPPPRLYGLLEELAEALPSLPSDSARDARVPTRNGVASRASAPSPPLLAEADLEFLRCVRDLPTGSDGSREVRVLWEEVRRLGRSGRGPEAAEALEHFWMLLDAWLRECAGTRDARGSQHFNLGARGGACGEAGA